MAEVIEKELNYSGTPRVLLSILSLSQIQRQLTYKEEKRLITLAHSFEGSSL